MNRALILVLSLLEFAAAAQTNTLAFQQMPDPSDLGSLSTNDYYTNISFSLFSTTNSTDAETNWALITNWPASTMMSASAPGQWWTNGFVAPDSFTRFYIIQVSNFNNGSASAYSSIGEWFPTPSPGYLLCYSTPPPSGCGSILYCENFEGWTNWTRPTSSPWWIQVNDGWVLTYTTSESPASLMYVTNNASELGMEGTNTFLLKDDPSGDYPTACIRLPSDQTECWVYLEWMNSNNNYATEPHFGQLQLLDTSSNSVAKMFMNAAQHLCLTNGTGGLAGANTPTDPTPGTSYSIWFHYLAGTGANSVASVAYAAIGSARPTSGNQFAGTSNGDATTQVRYLRLTSWGDTFDKIRVYSGSTPPPDNP